MPAAAPQPPGLSPTASAPLPHASWFTFLAGYFRPRPLAVAVEVALLDGDRVSLVPHFSLDGFSVPGALLAPPHGRPIAPLQTILGHRVRLDTEAWGVLERIGGAPVASPLTEAGPMLEALATAGVPLMLEGSGENLVVGPAHPRVSLALGPDDALVVTSTLVAPDGATVTKPVDLALLRAREGWHADQQRLVRIPLIASPLDRLLLLDGAFPPLHGTEIPAFLELLGSRAAAVGAIVRGPGVAETHRIIGAPATTDFRVGVVERHGQSLLRVEPIHRHERFQIGHDEAFAAHAGGERWIRRRGAWIRIDAERVAAIERTAASLGLPLVGEGFEFPAADRERVLGAFAALGGIRPT